MVVSAIAGLFERSLYLSPRGDRRAFHRRDSASAELCLVTLRGFRILSVGPRWAVTGRLAGQDWTAAFDIFGIPPRDVAGQVAALVDHGEPFCSCGMSATFGLVRITGETSGIEARLVISRCNPLERELYEQLQQARAQLRDIENRAESSPVPAIETDTDGRIVWHNAAAERLLRRGFDRVTLARLKPGPGSGRTRLVGSGGQAIGWARTTTMPVPGGGSITHLEDMTAQIRAEDDLDSLMSTLTETFAHLPQGVGIFDSDSKLILFNPAFAQILGLEPALLASRPGLRHFLEALRQRRMVPEQRDYTEWRARFIDASVAVHGDIHTEDWPLPSGQTLQVSVRRHQRGALAFIFEDITTQVTLQARYRAEVETGQATLRKLSEAVAVFSRSGQVTFANPAFERMLDCDVMGGLLGRSHAEICGAVHRICSDEAMWIELRDYILSVERDVAWHAAVDGEAGGRLLLRACALPDGSTLLTLDAAGGFDADETDEGRIPA